MSGNPASRQPLLLLLFLDLWKAFVEKLWFSTSLGSDLDGGSGLIVQWYWTPRRLTAISWLCGLLYSMYIATFAWYIFLNFYSRHTCYKFYVKGGGFEPPTFHSEDIRSIHWATVTHVMAVFYTNTHKNTLIHNYIVLSRDIFEVCKACE